MKRVLHSNHYRRVMCVTMMCWVLGATTAVQAQAQAKAEIKKLQNRYIKGFQDNILTPFETKKEQLDARFLEVLTSDLDAAKQSGNLDHLVATQSHVDAIQQGKPLPTVTEGLPERLIQLRGIYTQQMEGMNAVVVEKLGPLLPHMNQAYRSLEVAFTQKGLQDDALLVRQARISLKTEGLSFLPLPDGIQSPLFIETSSAPQEKPEVALKADDGLPFIDYADLPTGTVRILRMDGLRLVEDNPPGGDNKTKAVRVFPMSHFSDYLTDEGTLIGYFRPHDEENKDLIQTAMSQLNPMSLRKDGKIAFSRRLSKLPVGLDPASFVNVKSIAANTHAAAVLFQDGRVMAWSLSWHEEPEMIKLGKMHDDLTALWATDRVIFGRREASRRFEIIYSRDDASDFRRDLNRHKFKSIDASPSADAVIGIAERNGEVVIVPFRQQSVPEIPEGLGTVVKVRTGRNVFGAQQQDGTWRVWGDHSATEMIRRFQMTSGDVVDFGSAGLKIMWIER